MAAADRYTPPTALADLHILDVLELAGSQARAGAVLALHQSTVCRSLKLMQQQFRLVPEQGPAVCRHGHNRCLQHLRLASREHRLMGGVVRIGTDPLHHRLLLSAAPVQRIPARCRSADHWAELVRHALIDGALVSSYALPDPLLSGQEPQWPGVRALHLGRLELQLVAPMPECRQVLLPPKTSAPLLHQVLAEEGFGLQQQPAARQETSAWLKRAHERNLALPICRPLVEPGWLAAQGLIPLHTRSPLIEQLWLLLPADATGNDAVRSCSLDLRRKLQRASSATSGSAAQPSPGPA